MNVLFGVFFFFLGGGSFQHHIFLKRAYLHDVGVMAVMGSTIFRSIE